MQLWIGAHSDSGAGWFRPHTATWRPPEDSFCDGFGAVLAIAHVVILLLANVPSGWQARLRYNPAVALKQIWPTKDTPLPWPPHLKFAKRNLTELVQSLPAHLTLIPST